jgi:hypothetical protein
MLWVGPRRQPGAPRGYLAGNRPGEKKMTTQQQEQTIVVRDNKGRVALRTPPAGKDSPFAGSSLIVLSVLALCAIGSFQSYAKRNEAQAAEAKNLASTTKPTHQEEIARVTRVLFTQACTQKLLSAGVDAECEFIGIPDTHNLLIIGPAVNRVFAYQFLVSPGMQKALKKAGFATITFTDASFVGDDFRPGEHGFWEDYDLTR